MNGYKKRASRKRQTCMYAESYRQGKSFTFILNEVGSTVHFLSKETLSEFIINLKISLAAV